MSERLDLEKLAAPAANRCRHGSFTMIKSTATIICDECDSELDEFDVAWALLHDLKDTRRDRDEARADAETRADIIARLHREQDRDLVDCAWLWLSIGMMAGLSIVILGSAYL